jgi:type II secretory pathway component PulF
MPNPSNIPAILASLASLALLVSVPACWFVVRAGSAGSAASSRRVSRSIRLVANSLTVIGGFFIVGGFVGFGLLTYIRGNSDQVSFCAAITAVGVLVGLISVLLRGTAQSVGRLVDESDDDLQAAIDIKLGSVASIGWAGGVVLLILALLVVPITLVFVLLILFIALPLALQLVRARRQCQLLWIITVTVRSGRNLSTELRNHAGCTYGNTAAGIRQLAKDLEAGFPLGEALLMNRENSYRGSRLWRAFVKFNPLSLLVRFFFGPGLILPAWIISSIRTAEKTGTMEKTLAVCSKQYLDSIRTRFTLSNVTGLIAYLLAYASIATGIVSFLMIFIVPKFKAIFDAFGTELPFITEQLIWCADFAVAYWYILILVGVYPLRMLIRLGLGEPLAWKNLNSKLFAKLFPKLDAPDVLRQLSAVIRSGKPLTDALSAMAQTHQRNSARASLSAVVGGVTAGGDAWELLTNNGYLRSQDLQLIRIATEAGNLPWALDELASSRERTLEHRVQLWASFLEPAVVVAFGLLCAFIIIGFFMPVLKLVNDLS